MRRLGNQLLELEFVLQLIYLAVFLSPVRVYAFLHLNAPSKQKTAENTLHAILRDNRINRWLKLFIYLFVSLIILLLNIFRVLLDLFCTVRGLARPRVFFVCVYCVTDGSRAIFGMGRTRLMPRRCKQYAYSCSAGTDNFLLELTRTAS